MAILDATEFSNLCRLPRTSLPIYERRGQVVFSGSGREKRYDTDNEKNILFIQKMVAKAKNRPIKEHPPKVKPKPTPPPAKANLNVLADSFITEEGSSIDVIEVENNTGIPQIHISERKLKYLDALKREREVALLKLKIEKQKGEVVPADLVSPIFLQMNQNMMIELKNGMDDVIRRIAKKYDLTSEDVADFRRMVTHSINESATNAIENSKKQLKTIIQDYSEKRNVGERF